MPDESTTYQVVSYGDVSGVAADAAGRAVEQYREYTDDVVRDVADASAAAAVESQADDFAELVDEQIQGVANAAATMATDKVRESLDSQLGELSEAVLSESQTVVTLDAEQYAWIQSEMQAQLMAQILTLAMVAALCGITLWRMVAGKAV